LVQLDPNIFLYSEDIELCWRLARAGFKNYVTALSTIEHAHNKSGEKLYGAKSSPSRLQAFRDTLFYVTQLYYRGPLKKIHFWLFARLVTLNSLLRQLIIPGWLALRGRALNPTQKKARLSEHRTTARVFGARRVGKDGLWDSRVGSS